MKPRYSVTNAAKWSALGAAFNTAVGTAYVGLHEMHNHFETLRESFLHVAQPEFVIPAIALSMVFGAFMEFKNWYNKSIDSEKKPSDKPPLSANPK
jgi:hypothetical protein